MLLWLLHNLNAFTAEALASCGKITPRAALAAGVSFLAAVLLGPRWIGWLKRRFREPIKSDSAEIARLHGNKNATPTMGGLFVVAALLAAVALFGDLGNQFLPPTLFAVVGLTLIGAIDDLVKIRTARNGISARWKLAGQTIVASAAAVWLYQIQAAAPDGLVLHVPLSAAPIYLGAWFIPLAVLAIVGSSNAVNLADGLDGLAGGCLLAAAAAMTGLVYAAGHAEMAAYLDVPRIAGAGETAVMAAAMIGAVMGFLWFYCHPAQVFLGDAGSLPLGGMLGFLAVAARQELLLLVIGGVFVAEAVSVVIQVGYYKWRKRRIFLCAPIHHHFQFRGWPESKIVVRFWIAAALCAVLGVACLKLHINDPPSLEMPNIRIAATNNQGLR